MIMDAMGGYNSVVGHLLQQTLRCLCTDSDWVYAVFWRILPRNYPPPKWDSDSHVFDRSKGNKRNWILVWEDGFCDFVSCASSAICNEAEVVSAEHDHNYCDNHDIDDIPVHSRCRTFMQPELFFKMSHEVYNFGEGLMGKVAADSSHKWVYKDPADTDRNYSSSWQGALDPHPRTWEAQFSSGIETIAIVAVKEGLVQLGSLKKQAAEDLNFVLSLQRKFNYLHSIPGVYAIHPSSSSSSCSSSSSSSSAYYSSVTPPLAMASLFPPPPPSSALPPLIKHHRHLHHSLNIKRTSSFSAPLPSTYTSFSDLIAASSCRRRRRISATYDGGAAQIMPPRFSLPTSDTAGRDDVDQEEDEDEEAEEDEDEEEAEVVHKYCGGDDVVDVSSYYNYNNYNSSAAALHALLSRLPSVPSPPAFVVNNTTTNTTSCSPDGTDSNSSSTTTFDLTHVASPQLPGVNTIHAAARPYFMHLRSSCE